MSKHTFPIGHKFGGNKKKPYRTKQVGVRVPESLHSEIVSMVKDKVALWKQGYNAVENTLTKP
jgi:hypothetical protein